MNVFKITISLLVTVNCAFCQNEDGLMDLNGTQLYLKSVGHGEPILVVHGGPGMSHSYFIPHLAALSKDFTIIYYDQRASGKSVVPSIDSISLDFFVDDIEAIRKYLKVDKINILAHSWGAIPSVAYGLKYPDKVKRLIFCNAIPFSKEFDQEMMELRLRKTTSLDSTDSSIIKGSPNFKSGKPSAYKKLMLVSFRNSFYKSANLKKLNLEIPKNYKHANSTLFAGLSKNLSQYNYYDQISQFKFQVLILHGNSDAVPLKADQLAMDKIPYASIEVFKKSGHFIFIEENKKFSSVVRKFINR